MCPSLLTPANGGISYTSGSLGYLTMATYMCDIGYRLVGDRSRTCVAHTSGGGEWTGPEPTCTGKSLIRVWFCWLLIAIALLLMSNKIRPGTYCMVIMRMR